MGFLGGLVGKLAIWLLDRFFPSKDRELGRAEVKKEQAEEVIKDVEEKRKTDRQLDSDPATRKRLREFFTRRDK